uniref:Uncharacterized protein n=1 Tax=Lepeophtheirus salmonis TaxID=72036 RepID=A0A0K2TBG3_LEPSM
MTLIFLLIASFIYSSAGNEPGISRNVCLTDEDCGIPLIRVCDKNDFSIGIDETGIIPNLKGLTGHCVTNFIPILGILSLLITIILVGCLICCCLSICLKSNGSNRPAPIILQNPPYHKI